jgi:phosphoribosylformylglycinamidine synthase
MKQFNAKVEVKLKSVVLDPQGKAVLSALHNLGFDDITDTRVGKLIELKMNEESREEAERKVEDVCKKLLANPVIEDYSIVIDEV